MSAKCLVNYVGDWLMVKVSIITVCYNSEYTIRRTLKSVLQQSYSNIEYIIVDGNSNDKTIDIVKEFVPEFGNKLQIISEPDSGIYDAMNKGIAKASGQLIGILNSDDYYEEEAVAYMVDAMTEDKYQILYGFTRTVKDGIEYSISRRSHTFLSEEMIDHPACFVTKAVYDDFGSFDLQYISAADYDFMLRMSMIPEVRFYPVDQLVVNFSMGGMCSTDKAWLDLLKLKKNHGMITEKRYKWELFKDKVYRVINKMFIEGLQSKKKNG
ncbi:putative glycosyltransferase [Lachnospiraceae bacterium]|nr:putative glycosyltransferase [Lachnospiraceae bacterium]